MVDRQQGTTLLTWRVALLIVLALLGHDLLMTSAAHAAPSSTPSAPRAHDSGREHAVLSIAVTERDRQPSHPAQCGATEVAAPSLRAHVDVTHLRRPEGASVLDSIIDAQPVAQSWQEPFWPPGTVRALLQVYRL